MNKRLAIIFGIFLTFIALWLQITSNAFVRSTIERLDYLGYDLQLKAYVLRKNPKPSPAIVIVDLDDRSLDTEGRWPWPRAKLAQLVKEIDNLGAAVIAFDMFFSETQPNIATELINKVEAESPNPATVNLLKKYVPQFDEDKEFADALAGGNMVLAIGFLPRPQKQNLLPPPLLRLTTEESLAFNIIKAYGYITSIPVIQNAAKKAGFINIFADSDGIFRHVPLVIEYKQDLYPSLALQAVMLYLGSDIKIIAPNYGKGKELESLQIGKTLVPIDLKGQALIPFIGNSFTFPYFSATDVLHHRLGKGTLNGKIVFIGTSATGLGDLKATAIQNPFPGVEVQASVANGILEDDFSYRPAWTFGANLFLTFIFGFISAFLFPSLGPRALGAVIILLPISLLIINNWIWEQTGLILSFLIPVVLTLVSAVFNMIYAYLFESRRRERIKQMFGQYVPAKHIDEMLKTTSDYGLRGENRDMTVLFADIRSFTTISEDLSATQLVELLNAFFTPMTEIIFKNRGTIDKYVGDLIMAFWGAPLRDKAHAQNALNAALNMQDKIKDINVEFKNKNWPEIHMGIGINSGIMSVGDMGSTYRRNYTVLGDNVNLASRVEGLTKYYGVKIIVSETTRAGQTKFVFRKLDRVRVKGKLKGIDIFDVVCRIEQLTPQLEQELKEYNEAWDAYATQQWEKALQMMEKLHEQHKLKIYSVYIERIKEIMENPLPPDWDGIYTHHAK